MFTSQTLKNYKNTSDSNEAYIERDLSYKIDKQIGNEAYQIPNSIKGI